MRFKMHWIRWVSYQNSNNWCWIYLVTSTTSCFIWCKPRSACRRRATTIWEAAIWEELSSICLRSSTPTAMQPMDFLDKLSYNSHFFITIIPLTSQIATGSSGLPFLRSSAPLRYGWSLRSALCPPPRLSQITEPWSPLLDGTDRPSPRW